MEELDLKELFLMFWNKKLEIILITLLFIVIGVVYSYFYIVPEYTSATTLVLAQSSSTEQNSEGAISTSDLTMNSKLVSTYSELIKRNVVLGQVATNLNIPEAEIQDMKGKIKVSAVLVQRETDGAISSNWKSCFFDSVFSDWTCHFNHLIKY